MDFCLMENILPFSDDFRGYLQSLDGDDLRPITPPGTTGFGIFTADGKYVLAVDSHDTCALYPTGSGQPIALRSGRRVIVQSITLPTTTVSS
jgi:hypothetical protein